VLEKNYTPSVDENSNGNKNNQKLNKNARKIIAFKMNKLCWVFTSILMMFPILLCETADDAEDAILVLGDSWGARIPEEFLVGICSLKDEEDGNRENIKSRHVTNIAVSGSTAAELAYGEDGKKAFANNRDYDYVWLSIGGIDVIGCIDDEETIASNILKVISDVIDSSNNAKLQILFIGYGYPMQGVSYCGKTVADFDDVYSTWIEAIQKSSYSERVKYVDIRSELVTARSSPLSDMQWFDDGIHLNRDGYTKIFSMQDVQEFFGCTSDTPLTIGTDVSSSFSSFPVNMVVIVLTLIILFITCFFGWNYASGTGTQNDENEMIQMVEKEGENVL